MLTTADKKWTEEKFTKELKPVRDSVDLLRRKISDIHFDKLNLESRLDSIESSNIRTEEKIDKILNIVDGYAGNILDLQQENRMGAVTLRRYGIQIEELAKSTKTKISK
jgi:hypothetical protein